MSRFVYANSSLNWLTRRLQTIPVKNLTSERASIYCTKNDVLKNRFFSKYFMLVAFSSPVKFSKSGFSGMKPRAKFEVVQQKQFLSRQSLRITQNQTFLP